MDSILNLGSAQLRNNATCVFVILPEKRRIYLRVVLFLYEADVPFDPRRFVCVKSTGEDAWEPVKGRVEKVDCDSGMTVLQCMKNAVLREVREEAKIKEIQSVIYTGRYFESREKSYPQGHTFQYHIFTATVTHDEYERAKQRLWWLRNNKAAFDELPKTQKEKDDVDWYDEAKPLFGRWSSSLINMHLQA